MSDPVSRETIDFQIDGGIARLVLKRPDRLNSFTTQMHQEVRAALDAVQADASVRVLVLTGAGRGFCAGQDLSDRVVTPGQAVDLGESLEQRYNPLMRTLSSLPFPVICAVNGVAAGAGANLALAGDIVIATASAKFIQSFANIGLVPDCGGTWSLPHRAGLARALGMALTGEPVSAQQAADWGMIWKCVPDEEFEATVTALAEKFASAPTKGLGEAKRLIRAAVTNDLDTQLDLERDAQRGLGATNDYREGVAAFLEKRKPAFTGN